MIWVFGSVNMDLVATVDRLPRPGETVAGTSLRRFPGGKGANQAVAAARLGAPVAFFGAVGNDDHGRELHQTLDTEGIDTTGLATREEPTGVALITVDASGANSIVVVPGANFLPHEPTSALGSPRVLLGQLESPIAAVARVFAEFPSAYRILNPAPAKELPPELWESVDCLIPNESEAELLAGGPLADPDDLPELALRLRERGPREVIITRGEQGAYYQGPNGDLFVPTARVNAIDTTAAGDCFCGAYAVARYEQMSIADALAFACRAAAISVTRAGAIPSLPRREDLFPMETREIST